MADTAAVLADPSTRPPGTGDEAGPSACGPLLDSLTGTELAVRLGHVRELLNGYASGTPTAKWPVRYDTDDVSRIYFQDPAGPR